MYRAPLEESRKWAIYYIINLLFKTYFKLNSASLSRTILKALSTNRGDMPPLEAFPKSQRVTFKYYEGVLFFLEENYVEVRLPRESQFSIDNLTKFRPKSTSLRHGHCVTRMRRATKSKSSRDTPQYHPQPLTRIVGESLPT